MNKLFIVLLLAVCLVSVHAYVKRDAPAPQNQDTLENIRKQAEEAFKTVGEKIKEGISEGMKSINEAIEHFKPTEAPKP